MATDTNTKECFIRTQRFKDLYHAGCATPLMGFLTYSFLNAAVKAPEEAIVPLVCAVPSAALTAFAGYTFYKALKND